MPGRSDYDCSRKREARAAMRRHGTSALFGFLVFALSGIVSAAQDIQPLAERAIRRLDLQTELPRIPEPDSIRLTLPAEVLWVVIIVALVLLLYAFRDFIPIPGLGRRGAWGDDAGDAGDEITRAPEITLGHADELAARGNFVEAMHALLLQSLAYMRERLNAQFADSLTSREILARAPLPAEGRVSLRDIISRVEWTYFGEREATRSDYEACRASFSALVEALRGAGR
ncbi:MAG TPA: hypothetical protein VNL39_08370 [Xanthobacteraceae bacterium]|nr:hypothetical protein [Xanthobacteraceae bacterium]